MEIQTDYPAHSRVPSVDHKYTIRECFKAYRDSGGACWVDASPPELSVTSETGEITCMCKLDCPVGLPHKGLYVGPQPRLHSSLRSVLSAVLDWVSETVDAGYLWCPRGCARVTRGAGDMWVGTEGSVGDAVSQVLSLVERCELVPLSVSTVHAALESEKAEHAAVFDEYYPYPRTTAFSTGIFGTSHNNSFIDMSPLEKKKEPDLKAREFKDEYVGYVCAAHTSHSYEAGRSRRVTQDILVRVLGYQTCVGLERLCTRQVRCEGEAEDWTLFCCGQICSVNSATVDQLCIVHRVSSLGADAGYGLYISQLHRVCVISVCSGPLTKRCTNGVWADNSTAHKSSRLKFFLRPQISTSGPDFIRCCLSAHYSYIPFVEQNAAVRTSISSAQITQAVCMPYCPATAAITPCYSFKPIVTTPTYRAIMKNQECDTDLASYLPGENMCILYHNLPLNYEDAVVVSARYVQNGGFSTMSTCKYLLPPTDYVPPNGSSMCSRLCKWWKSGCQPRCKHTKEYIESNRTYSPFGKPTGVVTSRVLLKTGEQSVRVRSYASYQAGDKISTGHGQKGVSSGIVPYEDMPVCTTKDGQTVIPDIVMAVGSIVNRQTVGQIYESGAGIQRVKDPSCNEVVLPDEVRGIGEEVSVTDGRTGKRYRTVVTSRADDSERAFMKDTAATLGFVRVFNQSQMTRERHFTSHRSMGKNTLRTPTKRSRGGAVKQGEMEIQATVAAGLPHCTEELRRRGDEVLVYVCSKCQRLRLLHSCTEQTQFLEVTLPYDTVVLDCVNKIVYNCVFEYQLEPDT